MHELWVEDEGQTFCLAGPMSDDARQMMGPAARLVWTVEAESHFEAMTLCYEYMGWGQYQTDFPEIDRQAYADRGWE